MEQFTCKTRQHSTVQFSVHMTQPICLSFTCLFFFLSLICCRRFTIFTVCLHLNCLLAEQKKKWFYVHKIEAISRIGTNSMSIQFVQSNRIASQKIVQNKSLNCAIYVFVCCAFLVYFASIGESPFKNFVPPKSSLVSLN